MGACIQWMSIKQVTIQASLWGLKCLMIVYDILTLPVYFLIDRPWTFWMAKKKIHAKLEDEDDPYSSYVSLDGKATDIDNMENLDEVFAHILSKYGDKKCFGTRKVIDEEETEDKSGKTIKKLTLGDYEWLTCNDVRRSVDSISKGLMSLGIRSKKPVVILAETRVEWIMTAQALFKMNVPIVTLYSTLGEEGLIHSINETEVTHIISSTATFHKLKNILHHTPAVTHIVYMEGNKPPSTEGFPEHIKMISFRDMEENGKNSVDFSYTPAKAEDLAILMYTSGSTGVPKGVLLSHKNIVTALRGFTSVFQSSMKYGDVFLAYLPVAHIFELILEVLSLLCGTAVGYSSPHTLLDYSTAIKKGQVGDISLLKPTIMPCVPMMMDRIKKSIEHQAGKTDTFYRQFFDFAIKYKNFWSDLGFKTHILDWHFFKTYRDLLGGRVHELVCGSAPLSKSTKQFMSSCLSTHIVEGYGATEMGAAATASRADDFTYGATGSPIPLIKMRLVDWGEGNYFATDLPYPRGEIVIGGDSVSLGYYKREEATQECFKVEDGIRWFYSGDIGEVYPNGTLKIIDRKKDLVKLQFGEYIALSKVETALKQHELIENLCVLGDGLQNYLVALVVPNQYKLKKVAEEVNKEHLSYNEMCSDKDITDRVTQILMEHAKKSHLIGAEVPKRYTLCSDDWTPDSGLVTAALKIRRKFIQQHYKNAVDEMYGKNAPNGYPAAN